MIFSTAGPPATTTTDPAASEKGGEEGREGEGRNEAEAEGAVIGALGRATQEKASVMVAVGGALDDAATGSRPGPLPYGCCVWVSDAAGGCA